MSQHALYRREQEQADYFFGATDFAFLFMLHLIVTTVDPPKASELGKSGAGAILQLPSSFLRVIAFGDIAGYGASTVFAELPPNPVNPTIRANATTT